MKLGSYVPARTAVEHPVLTTAAFEMLGCRQVSPGIVTDGGLHIGLQQALPDGPTRS